MKLASHLWQSRHGIYYIRYTYCGLDIKRSLKTRDPLIAKSFAYKLGINMTNPNDILAKLLRSEINTKTWSLKTPDLEMQTDGTEEDHSRAMEALALLFQNKHTIAKTDITPVVTSNQSWTLDQCIQDYRSERNSSVKPRTRQAWDTDFRQLITGLDAATHIANIGPDRYAAWRMEAVDLLAPSSQDTKNNVYKNFFDWCIERKRCAINPVVSLKLSKNIRAELQMERGKERFPYDVNDLNKIFDSKVRTEIKKPCLYWMPLLALYTGARAEELAAIEINDITEYETGLWQMRFKKGKTIASLRTIPIHPEIINAGFLDYVDDVKRKWPNAVTLFPYMKPVKGRLTHRFSQDYGLFRNNLGLLTGKDFHSFRTTLIGCLIKNKAHHEIKRAYVGHENEGKRDEHDKSYGDKTPFSASEIATDIFPKIDYQYSHKFVMPSQSPYNKGRFNRYFDSALKRG